MNISIGIPKSIVYTTSLRKKSQGKIDITK